MSTARGRSAEHLGKYTRQAKILKGNFEAWDRTLRTTGEDWPTTLGRLNAALNQTVTLDRSIDDVMEHFVYLPKKSTAQAQDIPFFLSTRLETPADTEATETTTTATSTTTDGKAAEKPVEWAVTDPVQHLAKYEKQAADLVAEYERQKVQF